MNGAVTFNLTGKPQPWQRAGVDGRNGGRHYTKKETRTYERDIGTMARIAMRGQKPFDGCCEMDFRAVMPIPKSWSKLKRDKAIVGEIMPGVRPDLDNLIKAVKDGMNKIVLTDDARIVRYGKTDKVYGLNPMVVVTVREIASNG